MHLYLPCFLFAVFCGFQSTSLSPPWLGVFLKYFILYDSKWVCFLHFFFRMDIVSVYERN